MSLGLASCVEPQAIPRPPPECAYLLASVPTVVAVHLEPGTPIDFTSNPPATGPHFVIWAKWNRSYRDPPLDRGYWLHNLEHGGIALLYHCPDGCADEVATMEAIMNDYPEDPGCIPPVRNRIIVTADPLLPEGVRFAAAAWGYTYTAGCFDAVSLRAFVQVHHGKGSEDVCFDGDFPETDAGVTDASGTPGPDAQ
jgi:hypothetical protein